MTRGEKSHPKGREKKLTHQLVTRVGDKVGQKFRMLAAKENKSCADMLREMVESYCED